MGQVYVLFDNINKICNLDKTHILSILSSGLRATQYFIEPESRNYMGLRGIFFGDQYAKSAQYTYGDRVLNVGGSYGYDSSQYEAYFFIAEVALGVIDVNGASQYILILCFQKKICFFLIILIC
jgi:hypothetical protein